MWGAPSSAGWRHSATTWSQWSGTSKQQAAGIDDMVLISSDDNASAVNAPPNRRSDDMAEAASRRLGHADPKITERVYRRKAERAKPLR